MTEKQLLIDSKALISDVKCWTQGVLARDANGDATICNGSQSVSWCAWGSVSKASHNEMKRVHDESPDLLDDFLSNQSSLKELAHSKLVDAMPTSYRESNNVKVGNYNDMRSHKTVMRWFDKAIELCD